jgi:hypothetical protein
VSPDPGDKERILWWFVPDISENRFRGGRRVAKLEVTVGAGGAYSGALAFLWTRNGNGKTELQMIVTD